MSSKSRITLSLNMLLNFVKKNNEIILDFNKIVVDDQTGDISWARYQPGIMSGRTYTEEHRFLLNNGQYSILFVDQSFIQLYYSFDNDGEVTKARLAYYPTPYDYNFIEFTEQEIDEYLSSGITFEEIFDGVPAKHGTHLRIDYDGNVKTHAKTHLQFSAINSLRIDLEYCLLPAAFYNFVVENFFPDEHKTISIKADYTNLIGHAANNKIRQTDMRPSFFITSR